MLKRSRECLTEVKADQVTKGFLSICIKVGTSPVIFNHNELLLFALILLHPSHNAAKMQSYISLLR